MESTEVREAAPADKILYLPGGESEDQYAVVVSRPTATIAPSETDNTGGMQGPDVIGANKNISRSAKEPVATGVLVPRFLPQYDDRMTRSDSFDCEQVEFIGDLRKRENGANPADTRYGGSDLRPSQAGIIGQEGDAVHDKAARDLSPLATSSPASHRVNPFVSPLRPFTAAEDRTQVFSAARKSPSPNDHLYKSLEGSVHVDNQSKEYEHVLTKEDSGLYEPIEAPPRKAIVDQREEEEEEEGIYEPISPPKPKNQLQAPSVEIDMERVRSETPVSEASSFDSDEIVEEVSELSELSQSFRMSTVERERHELLPRFSVWEKKQRRQDSQDRFVLANSPYLLKQDQQAVMESIERKRPAVLPPRPESLDRNETKRYLILDTVLKSEKSYVTSLERLVEKYAKPLSEAGSAAGVHLSKEKVDRIFYKIQDIWVHHRMFLIALSDRVSSWHPYTKIGDVFEGSFQRQMVLDDYTAFVNNFEDAMEVFDQAKRDSSFRKFLKDCQDASEDKLDMKSLILKPIQRFPQFICCLQDMLKYTQVGHPDRFPLQMALTRLEFVANTLNERKRAIDSHLGVRELEKRMINLEESIEAPGRGFVQLDFAQQQVVKRDCLVNRRCCIFLLTDALICATLVKDETPRTPTGSFACKGKYKFKWLAPLNSIRVVDVDFALKRRMEQNQLGTSSLYEGGLDGASYKLREEQSSLLHDFDIVSQIAGLVSALKLHYKVLDDNKVRKWCQHLQARMVNVDKKVIDQEGARLDLLVPTPKSAETLCTFLMHSPGAKEKLMTGIQIALLKQSKRNNPSWLSVDGDDANETLFSESNGRSWPLFLTNVNACPSTTNVTMCCGAVSLVSAPPVLGTSGPCVWVCGVSEKGHGFVSIVSDNKPLPRVLECFSACSSEPLCIASVLLEHIGGGLYPTMWIGTRAGGLLLYDAKLSSGERTPLFRIQYPESVRSITCCADKVFVGLGSGTLMALSVKCMSKKVNTILGGLSSHSDFSKDAQTELKLQQAVNCMEVIDNQVWCAAGCTIHIVNGKTVTVEDSIEVDSTGKVAICTMACVGSGVWLALSNSPTVRLYHTETRQFLQEVSVDSTIRRLDPKLFQGSRAKASARHVTVRSSTCNVTCLVAAHGHLAVGTSCGHIVALPIAQLEGVPLTSGKATMSVHHFNKSAVRFLVSTSDVVPIKGSLKQSSASSLSVATNSSVGYIDFRSLKGRMDAIKEMEEEQVKCGARQIETTNGEEEKLGESESASKKAEYDPPWDQIAANRDKSPGFRFELEPEVLDRMNASTHAWSISDELDADLDLEQDESKAAWTQKLHRLLLAGGEEYKWSDRVADDAQILVWRVDY